MIPFILVGLATGAVYGLAGLGLVLTYKTSGILNFGYGAIAALAAFLFYLLHVEWGLSWPVAAALCLLALVPALGLLLELVTRSLSQESDATKVVATVGFILIVQSIGVFWHPIAAPTFPHFLPQSTVRVLDVNLTMEQLILFVFCVVASGLLFWFFRSARLGILMRAVVDSPELVAMGGDNPASVRRWAWIIGTLFTAISGLFLAPGQRLDGTTLTTIVFASFGSAAIGYFRNLPMTFVGGLVIGVAGSLATKYSATIPWVGGIPASLPFIILFVVLVISPRARLADHRLVSRVRVRRPYYAPTPVRLVAAVAVVALLAAMPQLQWTHLAVWSSALVNVLLFLSLGLLVRTSGQISLCPLAFSAVGAAAFGHLVASADMPWLVALFLATVIAIPVGALIAIPAIRVSGVFLALASLGFGIIAQQVFYTRDFMFTTSPLGILDPRPSLTVGARDLASDGGFYYFLLSVVVLVAVGITLIGRGRLGRLLESLADSPVALETLGATSSVLKVIVFCLSAAIASLSGVFSGMLSTYAVGDYFDPFSSLTLVALVVVITVGDPWYALIGAVGLTVVPGYIQGTTTSNTLNLVFGLTAVGAVYSMRASGTPEPIRRLLDRLGRHQRPVLEAPSLLCRVEDSATQPHPVQVRRSAAGTGPEPTDVRDEPPRRPGLEVTSLVVRYGGATAVSGVTLDASMGRITGLVGPNGAGKTSIFNACSGLVRPASGRVMLHGIDVTRNTPSRRARRGLGRTFQRIELFNSLTVRQNVAMGREAALAGGNPLTQLISTRGARRTVANATDEALALTGLEPIADTQAGLLTIGQRRLVELARSLAGGFDLLLLDEPSSGLDPHETEEFGSVLIGAVRRRGCGILLVEHDMTLVRQVCDDIYVLDFGNLIFHGTPEEMEASQAVRTAYLGEMRASSSSNPSA